MNFVFQRLQNSIVYMYKCDTFISGTSYYTFNRQGNDCCFMGLWVSS
jgi:hypothetical protein